MWLNSYFDKQSHKRARTDLMGTYIMNGMPSWDFGAHWSVAYICEGFSDLYQSKKLEMLLICRFLKFCSLRNLTRRRIYRWRSGNSVTEDLHRCASEMVRQWDGVPVQDGWRANPITGLINIRCDLRMFKSFSVISLNHFMDCSRYNVVSIRHVLIFILNI